MAVGSGAEAGYHCGDIERIVSTHCPSPATISTAPNNLFAIITADSLVLTFAGRDAARAYLMGGA